ncbi:uncharacterized protein isoform X1 [Musca autumnalis]|uniref:uncharacterized protein isoform X1 n=1 Tax=Musca autumnalis TaxID=221902 RepID=UPI003CF8F6B4
MSIKWCFLIACLILLCNYGYASKRTEANTISYKHPAINQTLSPSSENHVNISSNVASEDKNQKEPKNFFASTWDKTKNYFHKIFSKHGDTVEHNKTAQIKAEEPKRKSSLEKSGVNQTLSPSSGHQFNITSNIVGNAEHKEPKQVEPKKPNKKSTWNSVKNGLAKKAATEPKNTKPALKSTYDDSVKLTLIYVGCGLAILATVGIVAYVFTRQRKSYNTN